MSDAAQPKRFPWGLTVGVLVVVAAVYFTSQYFFRDRVEVYTASVTRQNLTSTVPTNGKVEPVEPFQAHAPFPGVVEQVLVHVGDVVKANQLLVKMQDSEASSHIATAASNLRASELNVENMKQGGTTEERIGLSGDLSRAQLQQQQAQRDLTALQQLQQKGAASAAEVAVAQQRLATAQSSLDSLNKRNTGRYSSGDLSRAQAQLADSRAQLSSAQSAYNNVVIHSPIAGTVYAVPVVAYDYVAGGEDLMDIADLSRLQIRAYFDEPEVGKLANGQPVKIVWDARHDHEWHGHILQSPTTIIPYGTRNVGECLITVDDANGDLLPNTNVTVTVTTSQHDNVLSIPREALHTEGTHNFVYRVVDRKLKRTEVQVGVVNVVRVEITSGLTEKDVVALNATTNRDLQDGLEVVPLARASR